MVLVLLKICLIIVIIREFQQTRKVGKIGKNCEGKYKGRMLFGCSYLFHFLPKKSGSWFPLFFLWGKWRSYEHSNSIPIVVFAILSRFFHFSCLLKLPIWTSGPAVIRSKIASSYTQLTGSNQSTLKIVMNPGRQRQSDSNSEVIH